MVSSTHKQRIGRRLLLKMGLRQSGFNQKFDDSHERYTYLKHYVHELHDSLEQYALQLARQTEAGRALGDVTGHLYEPRNNGFKSAIALKDAQEQNHSGFAGQIQQAFVKGIIEPVVDWKKELENMESLVTNFNDVRVQHDHYRLKVEDLATKAQLLEQRAMTHGDGKDAKAAAEKLKRNTGKLEEVTKEYEKALNAATTGMDNAFKGRLGMMNLIVGRISRFQETFYSQQLMNGLGVSSILGEEVPGLDAGIEEFVPKANVRHFEGELTRRYKITRARMWFRLVGSSLEVYSMKHKEDDPSYVVIETPKAVHQVTGVQKISETHLRVSVLKEEHGLHLVATDAADGQAWCDALERACVWDAHSSEKEVETQVKQSGDFLYRVKTAYASTTTREELERALGVTEALSNPPQPSPDRPPSIQPGGSSLKAGSGGGEEAAGGKSAKGSSGAGGNAAAGIAPGGEAGVGGWGAVPWGSGAAAPSGAGNGSGNGGGGGSGGGGGGSGSGGGKKNKKNKGGALRNGSAGGGEEKVEVSMREEKMPELVGVNGSHHPANDAATAAAAAAAAAAGMAVRSGTMGGTFHNRSVSHGRMPHGGMSGQLPPRRMPSGMGGPPPRVNMNGIMGGPGPMMSGPPGPGGMMMPNPPHVMMGPDGPVTLIQGSLSRNMMPGGPPVVMGPNGPVTLMGAGAASGPWGSGYDPREQWNGVGNRSFGTRFGPQRARPGILQRTRSLGVDTGPYGYTTEDLYTRSLDDQLLYPRAYDDEILYHPPHHAHHASVGAGVPTLDAAGVAAAAAAGAAAAAAINGSAASPSSTPTTTPPRAAATPAIPSPIATPPETASRDGVPTVAPVPAVDPAPAPAVAPVPAVVSSPAPAVAPVPAVVLAPIAAPAVVTDSTPLEVASAPVVDPSPPAPVVSERATDTAVVAPVLAPTVIAAAANLGSIDDSSEVVMSSEEKIPIDDAPAVSMEKSAAVTATTKAQFDSKATAEQVKVFLKIDDANSFPSDVDATDTVATGSARNNRPKAIDTAVFASTGSMRTGHSGSRGGLTGVSYPLPGLGSKTPGGGDDTTSSGGGSKKKSPYRGWRGMMNFGSTASEVKKYSVTKDGYEGAADNSSGADSRRMSDGRRSKSLTRRTRSEHWSKKKKPMLLSDDGDDEAGADSTSDSKNSDSMLMSDVKPSSSGSRDLDEKETNPFPHFTAAAAAAAVAAAAAASKKPVAAPTAAPTPAESAEVIDIYPSPVGAFVKPSMKLGEERKATPTDEASAGFSRAGNVSSSNSTSGPPPKSASSSGGAVSGWKAVVGFGSSRSRSKTLELGDGEGVAPSSGDIPRSIINKQTSSASTVVEEFLPCGNEGVAKTPSVKELVATMNKKIGGGVDDVGENSSSHSDGAEDENVVIVGSGGDSGVVIGDGAATAGGASFDVAVEGTRCDVDISNAGRPGLHVSSTSRDVVDVGMGDLDVSDLGTISTSATAATATTTPFVVSKNNSMNTPLGGVVGFSSMPDPEADVKIDEALVDSSSSSRDTPIQPSVVASTSETDKSAASDVTPAVAAAAVAAGSAAAAAAAASGVATQTSSSLNKSEKDFAPVDHLAVTSTPGQAPVVVGNVDEGQSARDNGSGTVSSSGSNVDPAVAQAKVFLRLCGFRGGSGGTAPEADTTSSAGVGVEEPTLSFEQLMAWDEVQELIEYGALKESEVKTVWNESLRSQDERTIASTAKAHGDIWGTPQKTKDEKSEDASLRQRRGDASLSLTQRGFSILVKLIEELQFEKELEQERGVGLVPGPVCVV